MDTGDDIRLTELVRRTVRARLTLLVATFVALFAISSALNSGLTASHKLDDEFLATQLSDLAAAVPTLDLTGVNELKAQVGSSTLLAFARQLLGLALSLVTVPGDEQTDKFNRLLQTRLQQFSDHDRARSEAFLIQLQVPHLNTPVSVNARQMAELWPLCLILALVVVIGLGYQQLAYEIMLTDTIAMSTTERDRSRRIALSEFLPGRLIAASMGNQSLWLFRRTFSFRPANIGISGLIGLSVLLSAALMLTSDAWVLHEQRTIIDLYYTSGLFVLFFAAVGAFRTRDYFYKRASAVVGRRVRGYWSFYATLLLSRAFAALDTKRLLGLSYRRAATLLLGLMTASMLFVGWTQPTRLADYSGIAFLREQPELVTPRDGSLSYAHQQLSQQVVRELEGRAAQTAPTDQPGHASDMSARKIKVYAMDQRIFAEIRLHLYAALGFIACCLFHEFLPRGRSRCAVQLVRGWLATLVIVLGLNLLLYFGVLFYQVHRLDVLGPIFDLLFGLFRGSAGLPMHFYQPTIPFWIFFVGCMALAVLSLPPSFPFRLIKPFLRRTRR